VMVVRIVGLMLLGGLCEIGGGFLVWRWLREGGPLPMGLLGMAILGLYGVVVTGQPLPFGRAMPPMAGFSSSCRSCGAWRSTVSGRTIEIWPEPSSSSWESPSWSSVREDDPGVRPVFHQVIPDASPSLCLRPGRSSLQEAGSSVNAGNKVS
jgi:small multidrug resistance family-3 protein